MATSWTCVVENFYFYHMCAFGQVIFNFPKIFSLLFEENKGPAPRGVLEQSAQHITRTQCNKRYWLNKGCELFLLLCLCEQTWKDMYTIPAGGKKYALE